MIYRAFGRSGLEVSALGFGAMHIGGAEVSDAEAARILNGALDLGITLIDTARSYGASEERIRRSIAHRRGEFALSTKVGYDVPGHADWTYDCVVAGVEAACKRLGAEVIDIVHLHSCDRRTLERGEVGAALERCLRDGKIRVAAYAGDGEALAYALECGVFGGVQTSINLVDQQALDLLLHTTPQSDFGVIAKRPLATAPWSRAMPPEDLAAGTYWYRFQALADELEDARDWYDMALRFAAYADPVDSAIVGTRNLEHLRAATESAERGPLPAEQTARLRDAFGVLGSDWQGII